MRLCVHNRHPCPNGALGISGNDGGDVADAGIGVGAVVNVEPRTYDHGSTPGPDPVGWTDESKGAHATTSKKRNARAQLFIKCARILKKSVCGI